MQKDFFDSIDQKRRFESRRATSGQRGQSDVCGVRRHIAKVPHPDMEGFMDGRPQSISRRDSRAK